jgi:acyl-CoA thioester hydrolase
MKDFYIERKIYYYDTDCGGVVYYANYLKHLEEGRNEFCLSKGVNLKELMLRGIEFPVVHVEVDYKSPAAYGDIIRIFTRLDKIGNSSLHFSQEIKKDNVILIKSKTVWACVGRSLLPQAVPEDIKRLLLA